MKQLLIGLFVWAFFCPSLWAQAKLRHYERAYLGFEAKAALLSPLRLSPMPAHIPLNRSIQARPNFAWLFSLRGLYNIHDRLALSADFGLGRRYNCAFMANPLYNGVLMRYSYGYQETNLNLMYRLKTKGKANWCLSAGLGLAIIPDYSHISMTAIFDENPNPSTPLLPQYTVSLSLDGPFVHPASPMSNLGIGWEYPIGFSKHLLLIELSATHAWLPYWRGEYQLSEFNFSGIAYARASNLSLKIAYLFS